MQSWELWYPNAAANGLPFARGKLDPTLVLWVHAAPDVVAVTVRDENDVIVARAEELRRPGEQLPMTRLAIAGSGLTREDRWPTTSDLGQPVLFPGGEVARLVAWWNAADGSEWRWQVELYNHR